MKNLKRKSVSNLFFVFLLCLGNIIPFFPIQNNPVDPNIQKDFFPKPSQQNIEIITPENKTYTEPMNGYYPATYGFENDISGTIPEGWEDYSGAHPIITEVISEFNGHKNVVRGYDGGSGAWNLRNYINYTEGTIEFWWAISSIATDKSHQVVIFNSSHIPLFGVNCHEGQIRVHTGGTWMDVPGLTTIPNKWDHISLYFRSDNGFPYAGLNRNEFALYYNGTGYGTFSFNNVGDPDYIRLYSGYNEEDYYGYYDAIGYSWDPYYSIGDNLFEGLLLSFAPNDYDWMGYSLDGLPQRTVLGNTTIPMPSYGQHNIQVFGNYLSQPMEQSDMRYFYISPIKIVTPENKIYTGPMRGYYPGTFGFESDQAGNYPEGWSITLNSAGSCQVIENHTGHEKVVELYDDYDAVGRNVEMTDSINPRGNGTVEFWVRFDTNNNTRAFRLYDGSTLILNLFWKWENVTYNDGTEHNITTFLADKWYHIRVKFDLGPNGDGSNDWHLWIDGETMDKGNGYGYANPASTINQITFSTGTRNGINYYFYIDAVGYSWDPYYNIGYNLVEGLLLSFSPNDYDWMAYSLNGQAKRTILGNTTIPMTGDGSYTIQVFGNYTLGPSYQSELRNFNLSIFDIISPVDIYAEPMNGFYLATYGFESDRTGARLPDRPWGGIDFVDEVYRDISITYLWARVEREWQGHQKILDMIDSQNNHYIYVKHESFNETSGIIEWYWGINIIDNRRSYFRLMQGGVQAFELRMDGGNFSLTDSVGPYGPMTPYEINSWYYHRLFFNCSGNLGNGLFDWDVYNENGTNVLSCRGFQFENNVDSIDTIHIETTNPGGGHRAYFDAFGFSWDPYYNIGDNLKEGLLLNFSSGYSFDSFDYSLDGQELIPIFGNHTIPFVDDGLHTIQVFGNHFYQSEVKNFIIDTKAPNSSISFTPYVAPNKVYKTSRFTITADDGIGSGISTIWYKINNSGWFNYNGPFNLSAYDYGDYLISYYAIDLAGHIEEENSILVVLIEKPTEDGINILLITFGVAGVVGVAVIITILLRRKRNK